MKQSFYDFSFKELEEMLRQRNFNLSAASYLYNWYYKKKHISENYDQISKSTAEFIKNNLSFNLPLIDSALEADDKTVKFLFKLKDQATVEAVLIPFHNKYSLCLSSQVGCAMNCSFCFTGTQGLKRNLAVNEIVGQFLQACRWLVHNRPGDERILNIVFMGQGEPLHNFDAVAKSCEIFLSKHGTSIGVQKITISTSGFIPGLLRWKDEIPGVNLALSLHSPFTHKRNELIPINKKYPLDKVLEIIDKIPLNKKQFITYEYLLIADCNDSADDAQATGKLLQGKNAYINLIAFNPFPATNYKRPCSKKVQAFKAILDTYKIPTLIRETKGDEVMAACGQLTSNSSLN